MPHVQFAYNDSASAATDLTPNEIHMGRLTSLSLTIRPLRGSRSSEPGPRPPRILRTGVRMPTERQRYCSRDACINSFSCGTAKLSPFGRFAPGSPIPLWVIGFRCIIWPPLFAKTRKRARIQGSQGQIRAKLYGILQNPSCRPRPL